MCGCEDLTREPQTRHHDKDERFMATSDLTTELDAIDAIEKGLQGPVRDAIVSQLSDQVPIASVTIMIT